MLISVRRFFSDIRNPQTTAKLLQYLQERTVVDDSLGLIYKAGRFEICFIF